MNTLIRNARSMDGKPISILVAGDTIQEIFSDGTTPKQTNQKIDQEIDATGLTVLPGLFDFQVHFRDPGQPHKETIETGSRAAVAGGFTRVLCMANTQPVLDTPEKIAKNVARGKEVGLLDVFSCATLSVSLEGKQLTDFAALQKAGAMAITDDGKGVQSDDLMAAAFEAIIPTKMPILDHAEDDCCNKHGVIYPGPLATKYNLPVAIPEGESNHVERGVRLSLKTGTRYHVLHTSTEAAIIAIREGKKQGANISAEVSPHHLLLCVDDIPELPGLGPDPNYKMNPTLRSKRDMQACVEALLDGTFDSIATDHAPHTSAEKSAGFAGAPFGIVGLETCFPLIYTNFVADGRLSLSRAVELLNDGPSRCLGIQPNRVEVGAKASMTFVDLQHSRAVDSEKFYSKCRNTPFEGQNLKGWPRMTIYNGKIVFSDL